MRSITCSSLEEADDLIAKESAETGVKFVNTGNRIKNFGNTEIDLRNRKHKILWLGTLPYIVINEKRLDCVHGYDREVGVGKKPHSQETTRNNCPANVRIKEIVAFPDFVAPKDNRYQREYRSKLLRDSFKGDEVNLRVEKLFLIKLPNAEEHRNHFTSSIRSVSNRKKSQNKKVVDSCRENCTELIEEISSKLAEATNVQVLQELSNRLGHIASWLSNENVENSPKKAKNESLNEENNFSINNELVVANCDLPDISLVNLPVFVIEEQDVEVEGTFSIPVLDDVGLGNVSCVQIGTADIVLPEQ